MGPLAAEPFCIGRSEVVCCGGVVVFGGGGGGVDFGDADVGVVGGC